LTDLIRKTTVCWFSTLQLNVDFKGVQNNPLTKEEQLAIRVFLKQLQKEKK
jgi:hypothetical protein